MTAGILPMSLTQIKSTESNVTVTAPGGIAMTATTTAIATNGSVQITSGGNINLTGSTFSMFGGAAASSSALVSTTNGGFINFNISGPVFMQAGSSTFGASDVTISTVKGGDITLISGTAISMQGGTGTNGPVQIMTAIGSGNGSISLAGTQITMAGNNPTVGNAQVQLLTGRVGSGTVNLTTTVGNLSLTNTQIKSNGPIGSNAITVTSANNISLAGTLIKTAAANITLAAGFSVSFDAATEVNATATQPLVLIRTDVNNMMMGAFAYPIGAKLIANKGVPGKGFVRIYSVSQGLNMVTTGANINGLNYVPAAMDTAHEQFGVSYPTVSPAPANGSDHYTIYYELDPL